MPAQQISQLAEQRTVDSCDSRPSPRNTYPLPPPSNPSPTPSLLTALVANPSPQSPKRLKATIQPTCEEPTGGRIISGAVDSGCTGHVTPNPHWLVNRRPCTDTFRAAAGSKHVAAEIGDMPVIARDRHGGLHYKLITNVRCVPTFAYTLLSVGQLWLELKIDSLFADSLCCRLHDGTELPYVREKQLPTLLLPTDLNPADFFTKPIQNAAKFFNFRRQIMNEPFPVSPPPSTEGGRQ